MEKFTGAFSVVMRKVFGEGTKLQDFYAELKALSVEDKAWYKAQLELDGHTITES